MDVSDHIPELAVIGKHHTPKWMLKQAAGSCIGMVNRFSVSIEKVRELLGGRNLTDFIL